MDTLNELQREWHILAFQRNGTFQRGPFEVCESGLVMNVNLKYLLFDMDDSFKIS